MDGQLDGYCLLGPDTHAHKDTCIDICLLKRGNTMCLHTHVLCGINTDTYADLCMHIDTCMHRLTHTYMQV